METLPRRRYRRSMHLVRARDFQRVYSEGNRARGDLATIAVVANGGEVTRLGLSIGKRAWRSAVQRNWARRIFREAFRLEYPELPRGIDVVVIGSRPAPKPQLAEAREELVRLVHKAWRRHCERTGNDSERRER